MSLFDPCFSSSLASSSSVLLPSGSFGPPRSLFHRDLPPVPLDLFLRSPLSVPLPPLGRFARPSTLDPSYSDLRSRSREVLCIVATRKPPRDLNSSSPAPFPELSSVKSAPFRGPREPLAVASATLRQFVKNKTVSHYRIKILS